ncbi:E3 ubiquitin/ISG15 ligase TRIM25-like [Hippoglossus hippoglossus]|uniref:E3 ubiquitin/ISG15 ligase TRIM25-like n=1 Tax=Hippoglossus hippoglossus TaxID=8267 RepID=UPI00148BA6BA|nr:E3 ubiquitin/ISG15 ligase TRIM25-like [Hippoglossus hippoglossus]
MAALEQCDLSLMSLEDELTCSICLSPFECPVTIPCGHNFCQGCLLTTWTEPYRCPQCRTLFHTKPELKKNTVLSTVVETLNLRRVRSEVSMLAEEEETKEETKEEAKEEAVIRCDTCMEAEAANTCLTCMASFCEEHLRPHRENPVFRLHQLIEPVRDLSEHLCPDHHKLMDLFCSQHVRPICSLCLQQNHKGCLFTSHEEQRKLKESELEGKLGFLDGKIKTTETVLSQMNDNHSKLKNAAAQKKKALATVYQQMREMLVQEECEAQNEVERELEIGQTKLQDFMKKLTDNAAKMRKAKEVMSCQLGRSQTLTFLKAPFNLPKAVKFEPQVLRISLDSRKVTLTQTFAGALKMHLTEILKLPVEARLPIIKPVPPEPPRPFYRPPVPGFNYMGPHTGWRAPQYPYNMSPGFNWAPPINQTQKTKQPRKSRSRMGKGIQARSMENLLDLEFSAAPQLSSNPDKDQPRAAGGNKPDVI